ncbi:MAG: ABC transporter ATP-binding protein [Pseudomonadota bacterium]
MSYAAITLERITRRYKGRAVVEDVDLTLPPGSVTALVGASGAGKSTLLRLIAGLEAPDAGEIRAGDEVLSSPTRLVPPEKRGVGLIFQDFALFPNMTALENVRFGLADLPREAADAQARAWIDRLGLAERAGAYPHQLSGGEQQRVSIARALAPKPRAVLMDEPFSGLDPSLREEARAAALGAVAASGAPALLVTHDAEEALSAADQVAIMHGGRILQTGAPEAVYCAPADPVSAAALGPVNRLPGGDPTTAALAAAAGAPAGADLFVRPEGVLIASDGPVEAMVETSARTGPLRTLRLRAGEIALRAVGPPDSAPKAGDACRIALDPHAVILFGPTSR